MFKIPSVPVIISPAITAEDESSQLSKLLYYANIEYFDYSNKSSL